MLCLIPVETSWMGDAYWNDRYSGEPGYTDYTSGRFRTELICRKRQVTFVTLYWYQIND